MGFFDLVRLDDSFLLLFFWPQRGPTFVLRPAARKQVRAAPPHLNSGIAAFNAAVLSTPKTSKSWLFTVPSGTIATTMPTFPCRPAAPPPLEAQRRGEAPRCRSALEGPVRRTAPPRLRSPLLFATFALALLTATACGSGGATKDDAPGCTKDTDCKADRICVSGTCQEPDPPGSSAPARPANVPPGSTPSAVRTVPPVKIPPIVTPTVVPTFPSPVAPVPPPTSSFRSVPESEWKPTLGPRLRIGAVVVHEVFEGPFGPSLTSLFVVTREGDDFFATVWADSRGYRNGPLANTGGTATKVPAVSFFDADGDGAFDALVMATYSPKGGGAEVFENVLLKWKGTSLLRIPGLETDIARLTSVAAVKSKLKK